MQTLFAGETLERARAQHHEPWQCLQAPKKWRGPNSTFVCLSPPRQFLSKKQNIIYHNIKKHQINLIFKFYDVVFHALTFFLGVLGLDPSLELQERLPRRYQQSDDDIFALVKHHMCDSALQQPPLLVAPGAERQRVQRFWKDAVRHPGELPTIDPERAENLLEFSEALSRYPQYSRATQYLRSLAGAGPRQRLPPQKLGFLALGGQVPQGLVCALQPRAARPDPHNLRVRFHRPG